MTIYSFSEKSLETRLKKLSTTKQLMFGLSCCERLFPNYRVFSREESCGNTEILRETLDRLWKVTDGSVLTLDEIKKLKRECRRVIPSPENYSSIYVSAALDAGTATIEALKWCIDKKTRHIIDIASFARDTVDMFIQMRDDMEAFEAGNETFEEKILSDPLMVRELKKQQEDLVVLENTNGVDSSFIKQFQQESLINGLSNLDVK